MTTLADADSHLINGYVTDGLSNEGIVDVRVRILAVTEDADLPLGEVITDSIGGFSLRLPSLCLLIQNSEFVRLEFQLSTDESILLTEARTLQLSEDRSVCHFVLPSGVPENPDAATDFSPADVEHRFSVNGHVLDYNESSKLTLQAQAVCFQEDEVTDILLGEIEPRGDGSFEFEGLLLPKSRAMASHYVVVNLLDGSRNTVAQSDIALVEGQSISLDIALEPEQELSEFDYLVNRLVPDALNTKEFAELNELELIELANSLGLVEDGLFNLHDAFLFAQQSGNDPQFLFALAELDYPLEISTLAEISVGEIKSILNEAIDQGIISSSFKDEIGRESDLFRSFVNQSLLSNDFEPSANGLVSLVAKLDISIESRQYLIDAVQNRNSSLAEFFTDFLEAKQINHNIGDEDFTRLQLAVELASFIGLDAVLINEILQKRKAGVWHNLEDLCDFSFDDWCEILETLDTEDNPFGATNQLLELIEDKSEFDNSGIQDESVSYFDQNLLAEVMGHAEDEESPYGIELDDFDAEFEDAEQLIFESGDDYRFSDIETVDLHGDTDEDLVENDFDTLDLNDDQQLSEAVNEWIELRANAIMDSLEAGFPSKSIVTQLFKDNLLSEGARSVVEKIKSPDFLGKSVQQEIKENPELVQGIDSEIIDSVVEELETVERISRITPHSEEVSILIETGIQSASDIASQPRRQFIESYAEALGDRAQAARVHSQAQQNSTASMMAMLQLLQALQQTPSVLQGSVALAQNARNSALKDVPDAKSLFGSIGMCGCKHCGSVYSPAAYFIDLLRYLDIRDPERLKLLQEKLRKKGRPEKAIRSLNRFRPLDVLLARRPDLADIPLSCENTLTPLPYIDLVNELLEARITGKSAAHDTGKIPADVLKSVPQFVDKQAYEQTREAVYPISLPFNHPLQVFRTFIGHLGVSRLELIRIFGKDPSQRQLLLVESLDTSPEELAILTSDHSEPWQYFGFSSAQSAAVSYVQLLSHAPKLMAVLGVNYETLIALSATQFINKDNQLVLESVSPDCDPEKVNLKGLTEALLIKMVRMLRLKRAVGWSIANLDRALRTLNISEFSIDHLEKLAAIKKLSGKFDDDVENMLPLWGIIDTFGKQNLFEKTLQTRAVAWHSKGLDLLKLQENRRELAHTADSLNKLMPALGAAFRVTSEDFSQIVSLLSKHTGKAPRQDLAGISAIYRVAYLVRKLSLRVDQLDALLTLVGEEQNPLKSMDPLTTLKFVEIVKEIQDSSFTSEMLAYSLLSKQAMRRSPAPTSKQINSAISGVRTALQDAVTASSLPKELNEATLKNKFELWFEGGLAAQAMQVLDPRSKIEAEKRDQFFDRHLATLFSQPNQAKQRLFAEIKNSSTNTAVASQEQAKDKDATSTQPKTTESPTEVQWKIVIESVLTALLPHLRTKLMRGAVVQSMASNLGLSNTAAALLIEEGIQSHLNSSGGLLSDFYGLLGNGLTASYFKNREFSGEATIKTLDSQLDFNWRGDSPVQGVPGSGFAVRWRGGFFAKTAAEYRFYLDTDGDAKLTLTKDGETLVLLNVESTGKTQEVVSKPVQLEGNQLYHVSLEYQNKSENAQFAVHVGTSPTSKKQINSADLYSEAQLVLFKALETHYLRLHKSSLIVNGFKMKDRHLEWLAIENKYFDFNKIPFAANTADNSVETDKFMFKRWQQLLGLYNLQKTLPVTETDVFDICRVQSTNQVIPTIVSATGWSKPLVEDLIGANGFALSAKDLQFPSDPGQDPIIVKLDKAIDIQNRLGLMASTLLAWAVKTPDEDTASLMVQAVKSKYDETRWLEVARELNDDLRIQRRDALVDYLLPRMKEQGINNRSQLFEYFLIDVDMNPCMLTSRIKQSISAVQTFFQRTLMNLEPQVPPRLIDQDDWKWLKNYRVWEANRKVFLYPENWIEPELRKNKSPQFQDLERSILQQEINKENVESAFIDYLQSLDEIARLDVRAVWFERRQKKSKAKAALKAVDGRVPPPGLHWQEGTYHIFARTFNAPHAWYYRRLEKGRVWTSWEPLDVDIDGDHLVPVMFQNRLHLFWAEFREKNKPTPPPKKDAKPFLLGKDWEIHLAYSVYDRGHWSRKQMSKGGVLDSVSFFFMAEFLRKRKKGSAPRVEGSSWINPSAYTLQVKLLRGSRLYIYLYRRMVSPQQASRSNSPRNSDRLLMPNTLELIGRFQLQGCNGELTPVRHRGKMFKDMHQVGHVSRNRRGRRVARPRDPRVGNFQPHQGGRMSIPQGYRVDAVGYRPNRRLGSTLAVPDGRQTVPVLTTRPRSLGDIKILPVLDNASSAGGVSPFFFQDARRSFFVKPSPVWIGASIKRVAVAVPLVGPKASGIVHRGKGKILRRRRRRSSGKESEVALANVIQTEQALKLKVEETHPFDPILDEEIDNIEVEIEEAWHPEDAAEIRWPFGRRRRRGRRRTQTRRTTSRKRVSKPKKPSRRIVMKNVTQAAHWQQRFKFIPFEHPQTCRLINLLKSYGVERLLSLSTTRSSRVGQDHLMRDGRWIQKSKTTFERQYRPSSRVDREFPTLDVDFDRDNPYSQYNWELFFHAPLQVAVRLAKDGRHEDAQRWFHFIFDPTIDVSSPAPQRYWRFAPFHENTVYDNAKRLMALLSYSGSDERLIDRQRKVRDQLTAWWENPFDPHAIAEIRTVAYQKAVVMKYIENLIEWGDKLFRRDTMESIQEATQIYILAGNILGQRPEKVPPMVETSTTTFRKVREKLDLFANWTVRFENSQVMRPFRINAKPDTSGAVSILGMNTQYFCIPENPEMDKLWDKVDDRLYKIRNCMNIKGVVRQLPLFEPPIDPAMLVRAAAAGADLSSVIASLNAPPPAYRFTFLVRRAKHLAQQLRNFGADMLSVLEKKDAESLALLKQENETRLLKAMQDIHKVRVKQVEEEIAWLAFQREEIDVRLQHLMLAAQELMTDQEKAQQEAMTQAMITAGVAEGIELVAKVLYAIPEFQTGAAGGFSSPFVTAQLGGNMAGDITSAVAESAFNVMNRYLAQAQMAGSQAEFQQRQAQLMHDHEVLTQRRASTVKKIEEIQLKLEIVNAELKQNDQAIDNSKQVSDFYKNKYTNEELYGWLVGELSASFFQVYKVAHDAAKLAERAMQFERSESEPSYIQFSYWDSMRKGLTSGDKLALDIERMESAFIESTTRALEITKHISLKDEFPTEFEQLLSTGTTTVGVTEVILDGDFPGHYQRRVKTASISLVGVSNQYMNVNCSLTLMQNTMRKVGSAKGAYAQSEEGDDPRFTTNLVPVQQIACSTTQQDPGLFELKFDDEQYLPFEGAGAISQWRINLNQADNNFDLANLDDVILTLKYTAKDGGASLNQAARSHRQSQLTRGGMKPSPKVRVSVRQQLNKEWKLLTQASSVEKGNIKIPLVESLFPARLHGFDVSISGVTLYIRTSVQADLSSVGMSFQAPAGSPVNVSGFSKAWPEGLTQKATVELQGKLGEWQLSINSLPENLKAYLKDIVLIANLDIKQR